MSNSTSLPQSVVDHGPDGRFVRGNRAAYRHGLRARAKREVGGRNRRVNDLLRKYQILRADQGRPLPPALLPLARRFVELETLATDLHAFLRKDLSNHRALENYVSATRALALMADKLGETKREAETTEYDDPAWQRARIFELTGGAK